MSANNTDPPESTSQPAPEDATPEDATPADAAPEDAAPADATPTLVSSAEKTPPKTVSNPPYILFFCMALIIPLLLLGLFFLFGKDFVEKKAAEGELVPLQLQLGIIQGLLGEIETYKKSLQGDVCTEPPLLPLMAPPLASASSGKSSSGAEGKSSSGADASALPANMSLPQAVEEATVMVLSKTSESESTGTAFFIAPGMLLTNSHVIENAAAQGGRIYITNKFLGGLVEATIIADSSQNSIRDYAILTVDLGASNSPAPLLLTPKSQKTERVSSWGYPSLLTDNDPSLDALNEGDTSSTPEIIYSEGVISVIQEQGGVPLLSHTAEVSHGNSGGPLVNQQGQVVGINTIIVIDENSNRQVNIALGSDDILAFISEEGITLPSESKGK